MRTITSLPYTTKTAKAWAKETMRGFYECPITPFTDELELDVEVRYNVEALIDMGRGSSSVATSLRGGHAASQWNQLHEIVADANQGRIPLWSIILDPSVQIACEKIEFVQNLGYVAVESSIPSCNCEAITRFSSTSNTSRSERRSPSCCIVRRSRAW